MPSSTIKYIVDNQTGLAAEQTIYNNLTIDGNVNITGTTNIRPYKVYTALLTQSGEDDLQVITTGDLIIGVTYEIRSDIVSNADFTNVGAPNNNQTTFFVATGTTPASWGTSGELRYNAGAPVAIVLENTIGNIWFTYDLPGQYYCNSSHLFTNAKTCTFFGPPHTDELIESIITQDYTTSDLTRISFWTFHDGTTMDDWLKNNSIEIRVYN